MKKDKKRTASDNTERKHSGLVPFKPGQSGNPNGRPKGSRNKLGEAFIADVYEAWKEHGPSVINATMVADPAAFLRVVAGILPRDLNITVKDDLANMTDDEMIERIRQLNDALQPILTISGTVNASNGTKKANGKTKPDPVH